MTESELETLKEQLARKQRTARLLQQTISRLQLRIHQAELTAKAQKEADHDRE